MTGEGIAQIITSIATLVGVIIAGIQQKRGQAESRADRAVISSKIDDNTTLTQATAGKIDEVHAATAAIAESTGTHPALKSE